MMPGSKACGSQSDKVTESYSRSKIQSQGQWTIQDPRRSSLTVGGCVFPAKDANLSYEAPQWTPIGGSCEGSVEPWRF